jgi:hypothetical protein
MNRQSQIVRSVRETVSLETLENKLPGECWNALKNHLEQGPNRHLSDDIYYEYFGSEAVPVLTEEEKEELFKTLGSDLVKGHYSTAELRSFLEREPDTKKRR